MATCTLALVGTASTANTASYTTGTFTPAAGDLLVVFAVASATVAAGSCTGSAGLTFAQADRHFHKAGGGDTLYCYVSNQFATAVSQTVTVSVAGDNATGCIIFVVRVAGMQRTGRAAVRQIRGQDNQIAGTPAPIFGMAPLTGNPCLGFCASGRNPATITSPSGWTEPSGGDVGYASPATGGEVCWVNSGFTGTTVTWGSAATTAYGDIIVELTTDGPAGVAAGTGASYPAGVTMVPSVGLAAGTGAAGNTSIKIGSPSETGAASGMAQEPRTTIVEGPGIEWGAWSATWWNTTPLVLWVYPGVAEGFGDILPVAMQCAFAEAAAGTGAGMDTSAAISGVAGSALGLAPTWIWAALAEGAGEASGVSAQVGGMARPATGTGTAAGLADVGPVAGVATGSGTAIVASVLTGATVEAHPDPIDGTGIAFGTSTDIEIPAVSATGTGTGIDPTVTISTTGEAHPVTALGTAAVGGLAGLSVPAETIATSGAAYGATPTTAVDAEAGCAAASGTGIVASTTAAAFNDADADPISVTGMAYDAAASGSVSATAYPPQGVATGAAGAPLPAVAALAGLAQATAAAIAAAEHILAHPLPIAIAGEAHGLGKGGTGGVPPRISPRHFPGRVRPGHPRPRPLVTHPVPRG
jgi:hypothetical protein